MPNYLTIDGFEELSQQQMFDMTVEHIQKTRVRSTDKKGDCIYGGTGCAASVFIKPDCRIEADRDGTWRRLASLGIVPYHESYFVKEIQEAHDDSPLPEGGLENSEDFMRAWNMNMQNLAVKYNLDPSKLEKL